MEDKIKVEAKEATLSEKNINKLEVLSSDDRDMVDSAIQTKAKEIKDVKEVIDLAATSKALQNEKTVDKIVSEKTEELYRDAEAKKIKAETDKIKEEVLKVKQQAEKEIAELEKTKSVLEGQVEELKAIDNKAQAFFDANKSILRCVGIREKLSLKAMQVWIYPASVIFAIFQVLLMPFSLLGFMIEQLMNIVEGVCGKIAKGGWKIVATILVTVVILGLVAGIYYLVINFGSKIF